MSVRGVGLVAAGVATMIGLMAACNPRVGEFEERGDRYSAQGAYADALVEYELALGEADGSAPADLRMKAGALALRSKSFSDASRHFDALLDEESSYRDRVAALYNLHAQRWRAAGDTFAAVQAVQWLVERDSTVNLGPLYFLLGDAAYARPDYDAAIQAYLLGLARARRQAPAEVYARLGDAFERKRQCATAIEYYERYLAADSAASASDARYRYGTCAFRMAERAFNSEDFPVARKYIEIVIRNGEPVSRLDEAELMMARIHEWVGDRGAAMETYKRIAERTGGSQSRAGLEAYRRFKQLEFGLPLRSEERALAQQERASREDGE
ncbi:MAG TPA: tetratricopeptide repeat protein [Gemmatimonadota bacterium]|nr:tetratricopeptide repeat protein [Gemmatimonadota bacterium]